MVHQKNASNTFGRRGFLVVAATATAVAAGSAIGVNQVLPALAETGDTPAASTKGQWGPSIELGVVPIAAAALPNNQVLYWSGTGSMSFHENGSMTHWGTYDLTTGISTHEMIDLGQELFCPGIAMQADGTVLLVGGGGDLKGRAAVSRFVFQSNGWQRLQQRLFYPRWYSSAVTLFNGQTFTIGGDGETTPAIDTDTIHGELFRPWDESVPNSRWTLLPGTGQAGATNEWRTGDYLSAKGWQYRRVFQNTEGRLLEVGPTTRLMWHDINGQGKTTLARIRPGEYAQGSINVQYAPNKVLIAGGSKTYGDEGQPTGIDQVGNRSSASAYLVNLLDATVQTAPQMRYSRHMAQGVVLPDGKVFVVGGSVQGKLWDNAYAVQTPEAYDPATNTWTDWAADSTARMYHSTAVLLPDGRVWVGGGGACGDCNGHPDWNHTDAKIFSPPYLFQGARPIIKSAPDIWKFGAAYYDVYAQGATKWALVRMSGATHSINTDQVRIEPKVEWTFPADNTGYNYTRIKGLVYNTMQPGYYMLFGMTDAGVPSVAKIIQIIW